MASLWKFLFTQYLEYQRVQMQNVYRAIWYFWLISIACKILEGLLNCWARWKCRFLMNQPFMFLPSGLDIIVFAAWKYCILERKVRNLEFRIHHQSFFNLMSEISPAKKQMLWNKLHTYQIPKTPNKVFNNKMIKGHEVKD